MPRGLPTSERVTRAIAALSWHPMYAQISRAWEVHGWRYLKTAAFIDAAIASGEHVLDVGCNTGLAVVTAAVLCEPKGCRWTAFDCSSCAVQAARQLAEAAGVMEAVEFRVADAFEFTRRPQPTHDLVTMTEILEHFTEPDSYRVATGAVAMVKPLGGVLVTVPNRNKIPAPGHLTEFDEPKLLKWLGPCVDVEMLELHPNHLAALGRVPGITSR